MSKNAAVRRVGNTKATHSGIAPVPWSVDHTGKFAPVLRDANGDWLLVGTALVGSSNGEDAKILHRIAEAMNAHERAAA